MRLALGIYFKCEKTPVIAGLNLLGYRLMAQLTNQNSRRQRRIPDDRLPPAAPPERVEELRIAMIADQMTWDCFSSVCNCTALRCNVWADQMVESKPHLFLCESAWLGNDADGHCWRGQIYKNRAVWFENRKTVLDIVDFCNKNGIPTVFFNKEDPTSFDDPYHSFTDLALHFDYIYTTAEECVERYQALGAKHCACMQMGVSLALYNPLREDGKMPSGAVFAGSWFSEFPQRCADMEALFAQVQGENIPLTIYDRNFGDPNPQKRFPDPYKDCIRPAVAYSKLGETLKQYEFALNINTVTGSRTMFARRVFEVMACGLYVISNPSQGLRDTFGDRISFTGENLPDAKTRQKYVLKNIAYVLEHHSYQARLKQICGDLNIAVRQIEPEIRCISPDQIGEMEADGYYYTGQANMAILRRAVVHFAYLPDGIGILLSGGQPFVKRKYEGGAVLYRGNVLPEFVISLGMEEMI